MGDVEALDRLQLSLAHLVRPRSAAPRSAIGLSNFAPLPHDVQSCVSTSRKRPQSSHALTSSKHNDPRWSEPWLAGSGPPAVAGNSLANPRMPAHPATASATGPSSTTHLRRISSPCDVRRPAPPRSTATTHKVAGHESLPKMRLELSSLAARAGFPLEALLPSAPPPTLTPPQLLRDADAMVATYAQLSNQERAFTWTEARSAAAPRLQQQNILTPRQQQAQQPHSLSSGNASRQMQRQVSKLSPRRDQPQQQQLQQLVEGGVSRSPRRTDLHHSSSMADSAAAGQAALATAQGASRPGDLGKLDPSAEPTGSLLSITSEGGSSRVMWAEQLTSSPAVAPPSPRIPGSAGGIALRHCDWDDDGGQALTAAEKATSLVRAFNSYATIRVHGRDFGSSPVPEDDDAGVGNADDGSQTRWSPRADGSGADSYLRAAVKAAETQAHLARMQQRLFERQMRTLQSAPGAQAHLTLCNRQRSTASPPRSPGLAFRDDDDNDDVLSTDAFHDSPGHLSELQQLKHAEADLADEDEADKDTLMRLPSRSYSRVRRGALAGQSLTSVADDTFDQDRLDEEELCWRDLSLGPKSMPALREALAQRQHLVTLLLSGNCLTDNNVSELLALLSLPSAPLIHRLDLGNNAALTPRCALPLALALGLPYEDAARRLGGSSMLVKRLKHLNTVSLGGVFLGDRGAMVLGEALEQNVGLKTLDLSRCRIGDEGGVVLCSALLVNAELVTLDLSWNSLQHRSAAMLQSALGGNEGLRVLNLAHNGFSDADGARVLQSLCVHSRWRRVDLSHNGLSMGACLMATELLQCLGRAAGNLMLHQRNGLVSRQHWLSAGYARVAGNGRRPSRGSRDTSRDGQSEDGSTLGGGQVAAQTGQGSGSELPAVRPLGTPFDVSSGGSTVTGRQLLEGPVELNLAGNPLGFAGTRLILDALNGVVEAMELAVAPDRVPHAPRPLVFLPVHVAIVGCHVGPSDQGVFGGVASHAPGLGLTATTGVLARRAAPGGLGTPNPFLPTIMAAAAHREGRAVQGAAPATARQTGGGIGGGVQLKSSPQQPQQRTGQRSTSKKKSGGKKLMLEAEPAPPAPFGVDCQRWDSHCPAGSYCLDLSHPSTPVLARRLLEEQIRVEASAPPPGFALDIHDVTINGKKVDVAVLATLDQHSQGVVTWSVKAPCMRTPALLPVMPQSLADYLEDCLRESSGGHVWSRQLLEVACSRFYVQRSQALQLLSAFEAEMAAVELQAAAAALYARCLEPALMSVQAAGMWGNLAPEAATRLDLRLTEFPYMDPPVVCGRFVLNLERAADRLVAQRLQAEAGRDEAWKSNRFYTSWRNVSLNRQPLDSATLMARICHYAIPANGTLRLDYVTHQVPPEGACAVDDEQLVELLAALRMCSRAYGAAVMAVREEYLANGRVRTEIIEAERAAAEYAESLRNQPRYSRMGVAALVPTWATSLAHVTSASVSGSQASPHHLHGSHNPRHLAHVGSSMSHAVSHHQPAPAAHASRALTSQPSQMSFTPASPSRLPEESGRGVVSAMGTGGIGGVGGGTGGTGGGHAGGAFGLSRLAEDEDRADLFKEEADFGLMSHVRYWWQDIGLDPTALCQRVGVLLPTKVPLEMDHGSAAARGGAGYGMTIMLRITRINGAPLLPMIAQIDAPAPNTALGTGAAAASDGDNKQSPETGNNAKGRPTKPTRGKSSSSARPTSPVRGKSAKGSRPASPTSPNRRGDRPASPSGKRREAVAAAVMTPNKAELVLLCWLHAQGPADVQALLPRAPLALTGQVLLLLARMAPPPPPVATPLPAGRSRRKGAAATEGSPSSEAQGEADGGAIDGAGGMPVMVRTGADRTVRPTIATGAAGSPAAGGTTVGGAAAGPSAGVLAAARVLEWLPPVAAARFLHRLSDDLLPLLLPQPERSVITAAMSPKVLQVIATVAQHIGAAMMERSRLTRVQVERFAAGMRRIITCAQLQRLVASLRYQQDRVTALVTLWPCVMDRQDLPEVLHAMSAWEQWQVMDRLGYSLVWSVMCGRPQGFSFRFEGLAHDAEQRQVARAVVTAACRDTAAALKAAKARNIIPLPQVCTMVDLLVDGRPVEPHAIPEIAQAWAAIEALQPRSLQFVYAPTDEQQQQRHMRVLVTVQRRWSAKMQARQRLREAAAEAAAALAEREAAAAAAAEVQAAARAVAAQEAAVTNALYERIRALRRGNATVADERGGRGGGAEEEEDSTTQCSSMRSSWSGEHEQVAGAG